jgi:Domain of unknown function (DUF1992)
MTERKPAGMGFTSWIDQQISEAAERGAFDDLPGTGKPLPNRGEADDGQVWLRDYLRKEGVSTDVLLPVPLRLRKEASLLPQYVQSLRSEQAVRDAVEDLNRHIREWRRIPVGPPIFVRLVDEEMIVSGWSEGQPVAAPSSARAGDGPQVGDGSDRPRSRWWHRRSRQRRPAGH